MPVVLDAMVEQLSCAAADQAQLADDQAAAAAAAADAAFSQAGPASLRAAKAGGHVAEAVHKRRIIHEGDSLAAAAAGLTTGIAHAP